jgi:hypothetical protein
MLGRVTKSTIFGIYNLIHIFTISLRSPGRVSSIQSAFLYFVPAYSIVCCAVKIKMFIYGSQESLAKHKILC